MAPSPLQQRRTHNTLLFQKLLNLRDGASPFTLVLDTLEQSGGVVVGEMARRGKIAKSKIIFISFTTLRKKVSIEHDIFVDASEKSLPILRADIISHLPATPAQPAAGSTKTLLIIDTLNPLSTVSPSHLPAFLSSLLLSPSISLLATYHTDIPLPISTHHNPYTPHPLETLLYISTAIITISNFNHVIGMKKARDKSLQEPVFGLEEGREGVLLGLSGANGKGNQNRDGRDEVVVKMELRRKSGRGIIETFVVTPTSVSNANLNPWSKLSTPSNITISLLDDHPLYAATGPLPPSTTSHAEDQTDELLTTFNLTLTDKQRKDREGVILPYFDAQREGGALGAGEGGRILYEMGVEDREDFDDEEDEI